MIGDVSAPASLRTNQIVDLFIMTIVVRQRELFEAKSHQDAAIFS
jgi:hypothetical protein